VDKMANIGDLAAAGKPLFTMYKQGQLWLEANVPEELINRIHLNEALSFRIDAVGREMRGPVAEIVPSSDVSTRTVSVRVHLSETKEIVPGMFGRLSIPMESEEVAAVPASALIHAGQLTMVDVVEQGRVQRRTVQIGRTIGDQLEILSGLASGEIIVLRTAPSVLSPQNDSDPARKNP
jgi:HlyD family secretion protein